MFKSEEGEEDFYSDVLQQPSTNSEIENLKEEIERLRLQLEQTEKQLHDTQTKLKEKEKENNQLRVNISKLYYTAKQEIEKLSQGEVSNSNHQTKKRKK
ncbi:hypothetical protein C9374_002022 [Naegleria lovaniensis]|uniref:Uncharacterized protein n=1 Tax=Naegleria lovaniensis TaxID=51637 RepID=A0AA88GTY4_NAELO|nr:uncharacterized protein C9374_002022 [Naegleria lovaniensis]KAG2386987.1 hypothetical protein C9374_002022 [Naegleria lovaniensis]